MNWFVVSRLTLVTSLYYRCVNETWAHWNLHNRLSSSKTMYGCNTSSFMDTKHMLIGNVGSCSKLYKSMVCSFFPLQSSMNSQSQKLLIDKPDESKKKLIGLKQPLLHKQKLFKHSDFEYGYPKYQMPWFFSWIGEANFLEMYLNIVNNLDIDEIWIVLKF